MGKEGSPRLYTHGHAGKRRGLLASMQPHELYSAGRRMSRRDLRKSPCIAPVPLYGAVPESQCSVCVRLRLVALSRQTCPKKVIPPYCRVAGLSTSISSATSALYFLGPDSNC